MGEQSWVHRAERGGLALGSQHCVMVEELWELWGLFLGTLFYTSGFAFTHSHTHSYTLVAVATFDPYTMGANWGAIICSVCCSRTLHQANCSSWDETKRLQITGLLFYHWSSVDQPPQACATSYSKHCMKPWHVGYWCVAICRAHCWLFRTGIIVIDFKEDEMEACVKEMFVKTPKKLVRTSL